MLLEIKTLQKANVLLIDDDINFCQLMVSQGQALNYHVDYFLSLFDVSNLGWINKYDVVIIDFYLVGETAVQITEYLDSFCSIPVMVISSVPIEEKFLKNFPKIVKECSVKSIGPEQLLLRAKALASTQKHYDWAHATSTAWIENSTD